MAAHDAAVDAAELSEGFMVEAKREATAAFAKYDADGSGAIDHEELFKVLMDKGQSMSHLNQLHTLRLDGCLGLAVLPQSMSKMVSLKTVHVLNCIKLINVDGALAMLPSTVQVIKEQPPPASMKK